MLRRANIGCGSIQPEGWDDFDRGDPDGTGDPVMWDVREPLRVWDLQHTMTEAEWAKHEHARMMRAIDRYDYAVCSFMLQELNHHEIPGAMENMMAILKPGGTLRILVPNVMRAFHFYNVDNEDWFPQDDRTGDLAAKFCTYVTWFGTVRSVFNAPYLRAMLQPHGIVWQATFNETASRHEGIVELDSRPKEALIMEVMKR